MSERLLELTQVTKSFGAVRALKGVSFDLRPGEVHALLGENGAGKSTLIKIITGAHAPDSGRVEIGGSRVEGLNPARARALGIACIYQQPALFPQLSVAGNIALRLEPSRMLRTIRWSERRRVAERLLAQVGAEIDSLCEVGDLSMPQQQLVEIACALGVGARILIMDEPTASLTQKEQRLLFGVVEDLRQKGIGIVYISHRLEEIFQLADRVTVLRDGESVGTFVASEVTEAALIERMVGREVAQVYPEREGEVGEPVLTLESVSSAAAGVGDVSLVVHAGEVVGVSGLVGAGRTELARVLFGLMPADRGVIRIHGERVDIDSPRRAVSHGIAYVPEDRRRHGIILEMSVASNTTLAIHERVFPGGWLRSSAENALASEFIRDLGIKAEGPHAVGASLSGGNQQKVSLARWLATRPRLLILDEPTQGVDIGAKAEIHKIVRRLARDGLAVLMISSDLPEVLGMSDRIAVMRNGRIAGILPGGTDARAVMALALGQA
ncbi:MAG: sugar ABC transporter ATP-binding protein [Verrucomicrobia bacterium]|nr:sugar ABC transporter ATP-binding protein [Verrucomicrobiota bacterium]